MKKKCNLKKYESKSDAVLVGIELKESRVKSYISYCDTCCAYHVKSYGWFGDAFKKYNT